MQAYRMNSGVAMGHFTTLGVEAERVRNARPLENPERAAAPVLGESQGNERFRAEILRPYHHTERDVLGEGWAPNRLVE